MKCLSMATVKLKSFSRKIYLLNWRVFVESALQLKNMLVENDSAFSLEWHFAETALRPFLPSHPGE